MYAASYLVYSYSGVYLAYMLCRCSEFIKISAPKIQLPLEVNPLTQLISLQKQCLRNNFMSSFIALAGGIVTFHFETIQDQQDECPIILCYSKASGTSM